MKTIKTKIVTLILFAGLVMFGLQSCKKYEDGSLINFQSRTERVANTWKVDNYKVNDNDYTSLLADYTETFTKSGDYYYNWGAVSGTGTWAFKSHDEEIQLTGISNQNSHTLVILKLEEKAFWYYYMDGNDKKEFHMVQY
jgi:hypothetical protein